MNLSDEPVSARPEEIESLIERVRRNQLGEQDLRLLERLLRLLLSVVRFLEQKNTSLARLKRLLFGPPLDPPSSPPPASPGSAELSEAAPVPAPAPEPPPKRSGHGRLPGSAYTGATPVRCLHPQLHPGACCPDPDNTHRGAVADADSVPAWLRCRLNQAVDRGPTVWVGAPEPERERAPPRRVQQNPARRAEETRADRAEDQTADV